MEVVNKHMANPDFDAKTFASDMAVSRMQLHRKIKALTNKSTTEFFRTVRLNKAAQLIRNKADNITQIAYETGFTSLSWFAKAFKEQFGMSRWSLGFWLEWLHVFSQTLPSRLLSGVNSGRS